MKKRKIYPGDINEKNISTFIYFSPFRKPNENSENKRRKNLKKAGFLFIFLFYLFIVESFCRFIFKFVKTMQHFSQNNFYRFSFDFRIFSLVFLFKRLNSKNILKIQS